MKEVADIEVKLLEDMSGVEINYAELMESLDKQMVMCRSKVHFRIALELSERLLSLLVYLSEEHFLNS